MAIRYVQALREPTKSIPLRRYGRLLATYTGSQKGLLAIVGALILTSNALQLVNPQIIRYFIDEAASGRELAVLIIVASSFVGVAVAQQVVSVLASYASSLAGWKATNALRTDLTRHSLSLDMSFHNRHTPGEMIERIDGDASALGGFFSTFVVHIAGNALLLAGILVMLFREDWRAGVTLAVFVVVSLSALARLRNAAVGHWKANRDASTETFAFIEERLAAREDIRTNGAEAYVAHDLQKQLRNWFRRRVAAALVTSVSGNLSWLLMSFGSVLALAIGAYLFLEDVITIGTVYMLFHYTTLLANPINSVAGEVGDLQRAGASIARIVDLFGTTSSIRDGPGTRFGSHPLSLSFEGVSFGYDPLVPALHDVSFEVRPGSTLGLIGRTGSGKTTTTRLILRLYDVDAGRILVGGRDIRHAAVSELRTQIGVVTQDVHLFHGTVRDNLTFFDKGVADETLLTLIEEVGLARWYMSLPRGLDTRIRPSDEAMSAGEAQLLAFARIFLQDPGIVILDEATSRLDRETERQVDHALGRLMDGRTVVVIAHKLATLQRCDSIVILEGGRVVESGERDVLASSPRTRFNKLIRAGVEDVLV